MSKLVRKYKIKNCDNLIICKYSNSKNWVGRFYVGRHIKTSGMIEQSLRTDNQLIAEKKAKELWFEIKSKYNCSVFGTISSEYVFDKIATEFLNHQDKEYAITKKADADKSVTTHIRERSKYERVIKGFLGNLDIRRIKYGHLERIKLSLISQNKSSSTISRYFDCISKILHYAVRLNIITKKPVMPKII